MMFLSVPFEITLDNEFKIPFTFLYIFITQHHVGQMRFYFDQNYVLSEGFSVGCEVKTEILLVTHGPNLI